MKNSIATCVCAATTQMCIFCLKCRYKIFYRKVVYQKELCIRMTYIEKVKKAIAKKIDFEIYSKTIYILRLFAYENHKMCVSDFYYINTQFIFEVHYQIIQFHK